MEDSIGQTREHFGGLNPKTYQILITHGEMDPLRTLSPLEDLNPWARVIIIHCKYEFISNLFINLLFG